jgi:hypothetical protein
MNLPAVAAVCGRRDNQTDFHLLRALEGNLWFNLQF